MSFALKLFRFIFLSILWVLIYFSAVKIFFLYFWNFDFYSPDDWSYLSSQWQGGWVIDSLGELAFFIFAFAVLPVYLLSWFWVIRLKWSKIWQKPWGYFKERARVKRRLALDAFPEPSVMAKELLAKKNTGKNMSGRSPLHAKSDLKNIAKETVETPVAPPAPEVEPVLPKREERLEPLPRIISDTPETLAEPKYVSRIDVKYEVLQITEKHGVRLLQDLKIGKDAIDFAVLAKGVVYLINLEPVGNEWIADESGFDNDEPLWFSETKYEESPVYKLNRAARLFSSVLDDVLPAEHRPIEVKKIILIGAGSILNYADIKDVWDEKEVASYRLANGSPSEIPAFSDFIADISALGPNTQEAIEMIYTAFVAVEP
ncbi:MAG: hypothetical protein IKD08_03470 [Alphaproteobacteria bacterium]|nr:hypothetical protein [Alphaproteobacteria bacterium]